MLTPRLVDRMIYNDRPAMVLWDIQPFKAILKPGEDFSYSFHYSKRPECYPPKGNVEVFYRLWYADADGTFSRFRLIDSTVSFATPSDHGQRTTSVALPSVKPGHYAVQYRAVFTCEGAAQQQRFDGPLMKIQITD